ncbi:MAG: hypothetical protein ABSG64_01820 [Solirubrobacteraceae bacterium]
MSAPLAELASRLQLSDDEALAIFQLDPLAAIAGDYEHRPEVEILDALTLDAAERVGPLALRRWLRSSANTPRPLALLEHGQFDAFEQALEQWLRDSGIDLRQR